MATSAREFDKRQRAAVTQDTLDRYEAEIERKLSQGECKDIQVRGANLYAVKLIAETYNALGWHVNWEMTMGRSPTATFNLSADGEDQVIKD